MGDEVCLLCADKGIEAIVKSGPQRAKHLKEMHQDIIEPNDANINELVGSKFMPIEEYTRNKEEKRRLEELRKTEEIEEQRRLEELRKTEEIEEQRRLQAERTKEGLGARSVDQEPSDNLAEWQKAMDLAPDEWLIWFLIRYQIVLTEDDKMILSTEYKDRLPDMHRFESLLVDYFGYDPKTKQVKKVITIYNHAIAYYLTHHQTDHQKSSGRGLQGGTIPVQVPESPGGRSSSGEIPIPGYESNQTMPFDPLRGLSYQGRQQTPVNPPPRDDINYEIMESLRRMNVTMEGFTNRLNRIESRGMRGEEEVEFTPSRPFVPLTSSRRFGGTGSETSDLLPELKELKETVSEIRKENAQLRDAMDKKEQEERAAEERRRLVNDAVSGVGQQLEPIVRRIEEVERNQKTQGPFGDMTGFSVADLLTLDRQRRNWQLEGDKLDLAAEKFRAEREDTRTWHSQLVAGIQNVGSTIGEAVGRVVTQHMTTPPTERLGGPGTIPVTSRGGNLESFECAKCHHPVILDKNKNDVTCLNCGTQYTLQRGQQPEGQAGQPVAPPGGQPESQPKPGPGQQFGGPTMPPI
jgi:hypothetical protein